MARETPKGRTRGASGLRFAEVVSHVSCAGSHLTLMAAPSGDALHNGDSKGEKCMPTHGSTHGLMARCAVLSGKQSTVPWRYSTYTFSLFPTGPSGCNKVSVRRPRYRRHLGLAAMATGALPAFSD